MIKRYLEQTKKDAHELSLAERLKQAEKLWSCLLGGKDNAKHFFDSILKLDDIQSFAAGLEEIMESVKDINSVKEMVIYENRRQIAQPGTNLTEEQITVIANEWNNLKEKADPNVDIKSLFFTNEAANKIRFAIKEIREDCKVDQRTFRKWLDYYFPNKYFAVRTVNLLEYIDIYQILLLNDKEDHFNFKVDSEKYYQRLQQGLVFKKKQLMKLADIDYKTLSANVNKIYSGYKHNDKLPYRLTIQILDHVGWERNDYN